MIGLAPGSGGSEHDTLKSFLIKHTSSSPSAAFTYIYPQHSLDQPSFSQVGGEEYQGSRLTDVLWLLC